MTNPRHGDHNYGGRMRKPNYRRIAEDRARQLAVDQQVIFDMAVNAQHLAVCVRDIRAELLEAREQKEAAIREISDLHTANHVRLVTALRDLLALLDRSAREFGVIRNCWTPADVARIREIRNIVEGK